MTSVIFFSYRRSTPKWDSRTLLPDRRLRGEYRLRHRAYSFPGWWGALLVLFVPIVPGGRLQRREAVGLSGVI
jgi:hypothetical protein